MRAPMSQREAAERVLTLLCKQDVDGYGLASRTGVPVDMLGEVVDFLRRQGLLQVNSPSFSRDFDYRAWYQASPAVLARC
jgi:hypothetical protein